MPSGTRKPPADWCATWFMNLAELRQVAAGKLPRHWPRWAREDLEMFTLPAAESLARFVKRAHARKGKHGKKAR